MNESSMKILHLPLKEKWYRMIESGVKKEEYREITDYWYKRLTNNGTIKQFTHARFSLGYPKKTDEKRNMIIPIKDIVVGKGKQEWGAVADKDYFIIKI